MFHLLTLHAELVAMPLVRRQQPLVKHVVDLKAAPCVRERAGRQRSASKLHRACVRRGLHGHARRRRLGLGSAFPKSNKGFWQAGLWSSRGPDSSPVPVRCRGPKLPTPKACRAETRHTRPAEPEARASHAQCAQRPVTRVKILHVCITFRDSTVSLSRSLELVALFSHSVGVAVCTLQL